MNIFPNSLVIKTYIAFSFYRCVNFAYLLLLL